MNVNQKRDFLINTAYAALLIGAAYFAYKLLFPIVLPFLLGLIIAFCVVKATSRLKTKNKWIRISFTILFYIIFGILISLIVIKGVSVLKDLIVLFPSWFDKEVVPALNLLRPWIRKIVTQLDPSIYGMVELLWENVLTSLSEAISYVSSFAVDVLSGTVASVPKIFIGTLMMIISSFFLAVDYENIIHFYEVNVSEKWKNRMEELKGFMLNTVLVVLRSYLIIMVLTFTELTLLFLLFGIEGAFIIAAIIAIFDIMPVLGTGGIIIPWAIISIILGDYVLGIELLLIYCIVTAVRNYVEPNIVGVQLGLHPIITLISMFVGLRLIGFVGMFGLPVTISFLWKKYHNKKEDIQPVENLQ